MRAEWINGDVATSNWPDFAHQQAARRVANLLEGALPDLVVATSVTLLLSPDFQPIPDVVVTSKTPDGVSVAEAPLVVVEVVSPDTWATDAVVKSAAYHRHGVGQYWLVQPSAALHPRLRARRQRLAAGGHGRRRSARGEPCAGAIRDRRRSSSPTLLG